ncbi:MAG TPA: VCBS repeat-containing protein [Pirellulales bacterium]|nr:VCBS repeat-containing protein [Pirellulales bacterium]
MAPVDYAAGSSPVAVGDFANNGIRDLAVAAADSSPYGSLNILMGNGDGTFKPYQSFSTGSANTQSLAVGDLTGDGKLDIVTANYGSYGYSYYYGIEDIRASVSVLMGNGDGTFQTPMNLTLPKVVPPGHTAAIPQRPVSVALGDMNHDGRLDAVVTASTYLGYGYVDVLVGHGDGTFSVASTTFLGQNTGYSVVLGDFSGDANLDVATAMTSSNDVAVLLGTGDGTLDAPTYYATGTNPDSLAVGDLTGNGKLDLVTANYGSPPSGPGSVSVLLGNGDGSFQSPDNIVLPPWAPPGYTGRDPLPLAQSPIAVAVGDLNGDGKMDLAVTAQSTYYGGYYNLGKNNVNILMGNGEGGFSDAQIVPLNGTNNDPASITGSAAVTVSPAAASTMSVSGFPSPITAGVAGNFVVTLKDAYGNVATGYTGTVHLTSSDAKVVLPANFTFTAADAGKHTFSATLKTAGTQSITATDTANANLSGSDSGITVKPAAASKFVITALSSVMPGQAFSLTVTVEDAYGNLVTGYTGSIRFSSSDNKAILPANYTFAAGDEGVHTFTGLVSQRKGNQTITVTDTKNSSITGKTVVDVV